MYKNNQSIMCHKRRKRSKKEKHLQEGRNNTYTSVSDPYSLNPDPDPAKNLNLDPGKFFSPTKKFA